MRAAIHAAPDAIAVSGPGEGAFARTSPALEETLRSARGETVLRAAPVSLLPPGRVPGSLNCVAATLRELRRYGVTPAEALEGTGITEQRLQEPWTPINREQELRLFLNAVRLARDPSLGLLIGLAMKLPSYGPLGFALMVSPTLRSALDCAFNFPLLFGSYFQILALREGARVAIVPAGYRYDPALFGLCMDTCLASIWVMMCDALGAKRSPLQVTFTSPRPANWLIYEQIFGCEVRFGAERDSLSFPAEWLDASLQFSEPVSHRMAVEQCRRIEAEWELLACDPIVYRVLKLLHDDVVRFGTVEAVAAEACVSERTLRRRLSSAGTSFQALLDRARKDLAMEYLSGTNLQVAQIADRLGYSETSSFRAAFRRWTGKSPGHCRGGRMAGG